MIIPERPMIPKRIMVVMFTVSIFILGADDQKCHLSRTRSILI